MAQHKEVDCYCLTCSRWFHHLGIASHRASHRNKNEDCEIEYSDGRLGRHYYSQRPKRLKFHPAVLAAHAQFGGDLVDMQRKFNEAEKEIK